MLGQPLPAPQFATAWYRRYGGLWRTQVLEVAITGRPRPFSSSDEGGLLGSTMRQARVLVGDPGGAQAQMTLPYDSRWAAAGGGGGGAAQSGVLACRHGTWRAAAHPLHPD